MCLLIAKPEGVDLPTEEQLHHAWENNPDGFGLAFLNSRGMVHIIKGGMLPSSVNEIMGRVPNVKNKAMLLHFRFATEGDISPGNCHPFPVSTDDKALTNCNKVCDVAVAHNGIIYDDMGYNYYSGQVTYKTGLSDTQRFVKNHLAMMPQNIMFSPSVMRLIEAYTKSKFAFLNRDGIRLIGQFTEVDGLWFSNDSYLPSKVKPFAKTYKVKQGKLDAPAFDDDDDYADYLTDDYADYLTVGSDYCDVCYSLIHNRQLIHVYEYQLCRDCFRELGDIK